MHLRWIIRNKEVGHRNYITGEIDTTVEQEKVLQVGFAVFNEGKYEICWGDVPEYTEDDLKNEERKK